MLIIVTLALPACSRKAPEPPSTQAQAPAFAVTAPIQAGADDLFEDVTAKAGITFVQQFCDVRIANII